MLSVFLSVAVEAAGNCFPLTGTKMCPELASSSVLMFDSVKDAQTFDEFMATIVKDSAPNAITSFQQNYQCPTYSGHNPRFRMSTFCYFVVAESMQECANGTSTQNATAPLCKSTCNQFLDSIKETFSNSTVCDQNPSQIQKDNRNSMLSVGKSTTSMADFCASLSDGPNCSNGTKADFNQCGFAFASDATAYCALPARSNEACCVAMAAALATAPVTLDTINNVWIISSIIAVGLIVLGLAFYAASKFLRNRDGTQAFTPAETRETKTKSFFKKFSLYKDIDNDAARSTKLETGSAPKNRSSLFTTIRASTMFGKDPVPPLPSERINSNPFANDAIADERISRVDGQRKVQVFEDYDASMDDEMSLKVGDVIIVNEEYDDGWAFGVNISSGSEGVFPMAVCEPLNSGNNPSNPSNRQSVVSARTQSLIANFR